MTLKTSYLVLYNATCCLGWAYVLQVCVYSVLMQLRGTSRIGLWDEIELPLKIFQSLAILEIAHALIGLVRSPVSSTLMQVSSRLFCLWAIAHVSPVAQQHWGFTMMVTSWACVEVPRYGFYIANLLGPVPSILFWLRYHLFMILYPTVKIASLSIVQL